MTRVKTDPENGCCGTPEWRGHLCEYHSGYADGQEAMETEVARLRDVLEAASAYIENSGFRFTTEDGGKYRYNYDAFALRDAWLAWRAALSPAPSQNEAG